MSSTTKTELEDLSQKNTYTREEKEYIMEKLNMQRLKDQKEKHKENKYKKYFDQEKQNILRDVNDRRLENQLYREIEKRRIEDKKVYKFDIREFHKFMHMDRQYYIEIKDLNKLSSRPKIFTLYYRTFGEMKKKDFLIKTEIYSDKIFISSDILRVYFKGYSLEDKK